MAGIKISNLPALPSSAFTDVAPFVQGGTTYKGTNLQVGTLFGFDSTTHLLALNKGGTNGNLTASNGGIFYSTASAGAILSGTATANQVVLSGSSTSPTWSTATYPSTTTINQLLYSSAANTISGLATSTTAVLTTSSGVPTWASQLSLALGGTNAALTAALGAVPYSTASAFAFLAPGTSGQLFRSGGAGAPTWTTATFPATAGTSGNVLVSDGTNWSSSATTSITALGTQAQALNMGSHLINNVTDPVSAQDAATKNYVDTIAQGITVQGACVAGTTATLNATYSNGSSGVGATLTNATTLAAFSTDGVSPSVNARILVKNQSTAAQNGIYTLTTVGSGAVAWVLTRATDYDQAAEINPGDLIVIESGTTLANSSWLETATVATVGTDAINFSQFTASLPITVPNGGTGLTTTTAYGLIAGGTTATGNFQNVGTGASGTILQGAGSSALPAYSTATYPSTATGTGTFLRADGTNWAASTLTIPNTAAINTIPYASSANVWGAISAVNSAVMISSAGGVPSMSTTLPSGISATGMVLTTPKIDQINDTVNNKANLAFASTGSSDVNYVTLTSRQTGNPPYFTATGSDSNIDIAINSKGTGGVWIKGYTDGSSASAGYVGEVISSTQATNISLSTGVAKTVTSITLTAGDWDIYGSIGFQAAGTTTISTLVSSISLTNNSPGNSGTIVESYKDLQATLTTGSYNELGAGQAISRVSTSTTYYLVAFASFAVSTMLAGGVIFARRRR